MMTWVLEDHLCKVCGGRVLRCVSGGGMTPGGNPTYKCADCGKSTSGMGPAALCWCGFSHRRNIATGYKCIPFSTIKQYPQLEQHFLACGCDPKYGEVGIVLERDWRLIQHET